MRDLVARELQCCSKNHPPFGFLVLGDNVCSPGCDQLPADLLLHCEWAVLVNRKKRLIRLEVGQNLLDSIKLGLILGILARQYDTGPAPPISSCFDNPADSAFGKSMSLER